MMLNPFRKLREKGQRKVMQLILLAVIRNGLKVAGMAGLFSDSQVNEYAGAVSLVLGLTWTAFNTWREHQAKPAS